MFLLTAVVSTTESQCPHPLIHTYYLILDMILDDWRAKKAVVFKRPTLYMNPKQFLKQFTELATRSFSSIDSITLHGTVMSYILSYLFRQIINKLTNSVINLIHYSGIDKQGV